MTITTAKRLKTHVGNDAATVFPYDFYIPDAASLEVSLYSSVTGVTTVLNSATYSVTGLGDPNFGSVTYPLSGSPITTTQTLIIKRIVPYTQTVDISNQGGYQPEIFEAALDRVAMQAGQVAEETGRSLLGFPGETFDTTFGKKADIANKYAAFDANGDPTTTSTTPEADAAVTAAQAAQAAAETAETNAETAQAAAETAQAAAEAAASSTLLLDGSRTMTGALATTEISTPATPATNVHKVYFKSDGLLYTLDDAGIERLVLQSPQRGYIYGFTLSNNGTDATNDIDIASGEAASGDTVPYLIQLASGLTKRLDATWAAGTNQGMRDSALNAGAIANRTYFLYAVAKAGGADVDIYATSATTAAAAITALNLETGGSAYIYAKYIGPIVRNAGAILSFTQLGDEFWYKTLTQDIAATNPGATAVNASLTVPIGIQVLVHCSIALEDSSGSTIYLLARATDDTDETPSSTLYDLYVLNAAGSSQKSSKDKDIRCNTSGQIEYKLSGSTANTIVRIQTRGWTDLKRRYG